jgi:hypothetical protein
VSKITAASLFLIMVGFVICLIAVPALSYDDLPLSPPRQGLEDPEDPEDPGETDDPTLYDEELPCETNSIFYVIDISGSMDWNTSSYVGLDGEPTSGSLLDRAKVELIRSIIALPEDFAFNILAYDCSARRWRLDMVDALPLNKTDATHWINLLRSGGGTGTGPAASLALQDKGNLTLVILSDGSPNCGASGIGGHAAMILGANTQDATIHTFGIGAYGQFEAFLRSLAASTGGIYHAVN